MKIYNYNPEKEYIGESDADINPLEPGSFLIPANATTVKPPDIPEEKRAIFNGEKWQLEAILQPEIEQEPEQIVRYIFSPQDKFLLSSPRSQLYQLGKNSQGQSRVEFEEVREIINGRMIFIPEAIAPNGLLQKNLQELVAALGDDVTEEAIAEFNQLLKDDLGVEWEI
ncbi:hypothetical protein [Spirulina sp. 06S082]|uniref:hypothetical protein n=1 Tax=Spirulina sp. 06S082 TaxID=3110248 RepID=UPI002B207FE4|nr:hypothetical protein [Spirulina sp. 06S082]MEA5467981.1 hypothetical protein [Spirulina sp. 06S082]